MSPLWHREQFELLLRADLEKAREEFLNANPDQSLAASERFRQALDNFTAFILRAEGQKPIKPAQGGGAYGTRRTAA